MAPTAFVTNTKGTPFSNLANVNQAFEHDPKLAGSVWYDAFLDRILTGAPGYEREWTDGDDALAAVYLQRTHNLQQVTSRMVSEVVNIYARASPRHVVRDYLTGLSWDGLPRIARAFELLWQAEVTPQQPQDYLRAVSQNFFVGLVARVLRPGCQLDEMVVFESALQGLGKTSALRVLGGAWYAVAHERITGKDFFQDLQGKWLVEISELSAFSRAEVERIKTVISTPTDRYRASYGRRSGDHPRQCIFAGTTNRDDWGNDDTGLRRFWPVTVGLVDLPALTAQRDQLLAEAAHLCRAGATWWQVPSQAAKDVQEAHQSADEWTKPVMDYAELAILSAQHVTVLDIMQLGMRLPLAQLDKGSQMRVAGILRRHHWERRTIRNGAIVLKAWLPPVNNGVPTFSQQVATF